MDSIIILGSSNAVPDQDHDNTHLLIRSAQRAILVDCGNNPLQNLKRVGIMPNDLTDLILTHFHPDHVASSPLLLMGLWLLGRDRPLVIHGLAHTIDRMEKMMELYNWEKWPGFYPVTFNRLPEEEGAAVILGDDVRLYSSPVRHLLPTMGLRVEFLESGKVAAYSSDTEPCGEVERLAQGADVLIHEATGASEGHSSAEQAGQVAANAGARSLALIHYNGGTNMETLVEAARQTFSGPVYLAEDFKPVRLFE